MRIYRPLFPIAAAIVSLVTVIAWLVAGLPAAAPLVSPTAAAPLVSPTALAAGGAAAVPATSPGATPTRRSAAADPVVVPRMSCGPAAAGAASVSPTVSSNPPGASPGGRAEALQVPILMYHRIVPPAEAGGSLPSLVVPPDLFAAQMAALDAAGWRTITVSALAADLAAGRSPARRTFVVTFDDGYDDGYRYALPILQAHHFVATYYIVAGRIGDPVDLSAEHVRALAAAGMEIGDHTMNHLDLPRLDTASLHYQIAGAAERIAGIMGRRPMTFAYPFGAEDPAVRGVVAGCGFALAVTNVEGVGERWADRFLVPRLRVGPGTSPVELTRRLAPYG